MKVPDPVKRACQVLRKRVRFDGARITIAGSKSSGDDTAIIRQATEAYIETWVVPIIDAIERGDVRSCRFMSEGFGEGHQIGKHPVEVEP